MASLTIRGIPEELLEQLRKSARGNHRSLNGEVIYRLERSMNTTPVDAEAVLARIQALRARMHAPPLTDEVLRRAIEEGRP